MPRRKVWMIALCIASVTCSLSVLSFTCQKRSASPVIARVGHEVLTLQDLYDRIPAQLSDRITREEKINYVKHWIDTELLYQEALRQKIQKEREISMRLKQMQKDLLSSEMISRNTVATAKYPVSDEAVRAYYEKHKNEFVRETDVVKYLEIVVNDQKSAWEVHALVTQDNFFDLAVKYSKAPVQDPRAIPFIPVTALPKELAGLIPTIKIGGTTAPILTDGQYHIVRILDKQQAGTAASLDEVREEIVSALSTDGQKKYMEELLSSLRLKTDYEIHFETIPIDTADTIHGPEGS